MYFYCVYAGASYNGESPQMPFIFAVSDFRVVFKGVKLQKIFGLATLRGLKKRVLNDYYNLVKSLFKYCVFGLLGITLHPNK